MFGKVGGGLPTAKSTVAPEYISEHSGGIKQLKNPIGITRATSEKNENNINNKSKVLIVINLSQ